MLAIRGYGRNLWYKSCVIDSPPLSPSCLLLHTTVTSSSSLPSPSRRWRPTRTLVFPSQLQMLFLRQLQFAVQPRIHFSPMHEVTEPTTHTLARLVLSTTSFSEVSDRTEFSVYRSSGIPPRVEVVDRLLSIFFVLEPCVHVAYQMIASIVADDDGFYFSVLGQFAKHVFVECVKVGLDLGFAELIVLFVSGILI